MNFLEAVKELEGRCKGIRIGESRYKMASPGLINVVTCDGPLLSYEDYLSTDWQLVDPIPQYEEVKVRQIAAMDGPDVIACFDNMEEFDTYNNDHACQFGYLELTGTYRREVKPKVKRRELLERVTLNGCQLHYINPQKYKIPLTAKVCAEWEE